VGLRELLDLLSRPVGAPVILRGEGTAGGHDWRTETRKGMPVMVCRRCPVVWWPDRSEPKRACVALSPRPDGGEPR
jgi:hypothetical protein